MRLVHKSRVADAGLDPPVIGAADVAERHPDARMKRVVIGQILAFDRRMMARHLHAARCPHVRKVRPRDLVVLVAINRDRKPIDSDGDSSVAKRQTQLAARLPLRQPKLLPLRRWP